MSDQTLYEQSNVSQGTAEPFVQRQTVYVIDQNNGSYSGQIQADTASLSNSGKYAAYSEAYFEVPLVLRLTAKSANAKTVGMRALEPSFALGLKSGYHNIFHSYSVEYNNRTVVSLTPFSNIYTTFRMLTKLSQDDLVKYGSLIGFFPDSTVSVRYEGGLGASPFGHGSLNNRNITQLAPTVADWASVVNGGYNEGFFKRQLTTTATNPAVAPTSALFSTAAAGAIGYNYFLNGSVANNIDSKWWFVLATVRLKDITDFFQKLPLVKGAFIKFQLNTNTAIHQIRVSVAGGVCTDVSCLQNNIVGGSSPLLLSNGNQSGNGFNPIVAECIGIGAGDYDFEIALSIARDTTYNLQHPTLQALRVYVPLYTFSPSVEQQYLSLNKSKKIVYRDIYQYQVDVSTSGGQGQFNQLITNGIVGIKSVIIVPFIGASSNACGVGGAAPTVPFGSPFASEPSTTSPYIALSNFNLALSGVNIYTLNELYDFSNFQDELSKANSVMGGIVDGLSSGLIGFNEFQTNYRYMYIDCSRRLSAEDFVAKSVQITGTVYAQQPNVSLYVFIEQEKEITIDLETGALIG